MSATITITDMRAFEDALRGCECHIFEFWRRSGRESQLSLCGAISRQEQPPHNPARQTWGQVATEDTCPACGQPRCPKCRALSERKAGA